MTKNPPTRDMPPDWLCNWLRVAFLGNISRNVRQISFSYNAKEKRLLLRKFTDNRDTALDYENLRVAASELDAYCGDILQNIDIECVYSAAPVTPEMIDDLDAHFFSRYESDEGVND